MQALCLFKNKYLDVIVCVCVYVKVTVMNSIKVITKQCTVIKMFSTSGVQVVELQK